MAKQEGNTSISPLTINPDLRQSLETCFETICETTGVYVTYETICIYI